MICGPCSHKWHNGCRRGSWCDCQHVSPNDMEPYTQTAMRFLYLTANMSAVNGRDYRETAASDGE